MTLVLHVPGDPVAAPRPRTSRGRTYDPKSAQKIKHALLIKAQLPDDHVRWSAAVSLRVDFRMPIPKSYSKKKRAELAGKPHIFRPDTDNLLKHIKDCMTMAGVWSDDSIVSILIASKIYSTIPETIITTYTLGEGNGS